MGIVGVSVLLAVVPLLLYLFFPFGIHLPRKARLLHDPDKLSPPRLEAMETSSNLLGGSKNASNTSRDTHISLTTGRPSPATPHKSSASNLMPPPPPRTTLPPSPSESTPASTLRVPSSGPLPNRASATISSSSNSLPSSTKASLNAPDTSALSASSLNPGTTSSKPRRKVLLSPGHSPLDWAQLTRSGRNLAGTPSPQKVTATQLAWHNGRQGRPAWAAWKGRVYNITEYLPFHPGGKGELMRAAGKHGEVVETLFMEVHPWVSWESMLGACWVGWLVEDS